MIFNVVSLFRYYLPLEKGVALHLNKCDSPPPKNALCQFWLKLSQWFLRRRFLNFVNVFSLFRYYLPSEKGMALHFLFTQWCFVPRLVEIGPVVLKKKIFKLCQCIFAISLLSPLRKGRGPSFDQTWILITQECFVPTLFEIGPVVLRKKIFQVRQCIFAISLLSPLWKGRGPSFEQTWIPISEGCFVPSRLKLAQWFLRRSRK